jgi:hypothetical protein
MKVRVRFDIRAKGKESDKDERAKVGRRAAVTYRISDA